MHSWPSAASTPIGSSQIAWTQFQLEKPVAAVTSPPATAAPSAK